MHYAILRWRLLLHNLCTSFWGNKTVYTWCALTGITLSMAGSNTAKTMKMVILNLCRYFSNNSIPVFDSGCRMRKLAILLIKQFEMFIRHVQPPDPTHHPLKFRIHIQISKFQNSMYLGALHDGPGDKTFCFYRGFVFYSSLFRWFSGHYRDIIMGAMASQITSLTIIYSTVYSGAGQRKHQSPAWLAFVHQWLVNSPHKWPVTRQKFPFDDVIIFDLLKTHSTQTSAIVSWCSSNVKVVLILETWLRWDNQGIQYAWIKWCLDDFVHCVIRASLGIAF